MYFVYDLLHLAAAKTKYLSVKSDPERRANCISYGLMAMLNAVLTIAAVFGFQWGFTFFVANSIGFYILGWTLVIIFGVTVLTQLVQGAINMVWQLKLNKKLVGYLAFFLWLMSIVGVVLILLLFKL